MNNLVGDATGFKKAMAEAERSMKRMDAELARIKQRRRWRFWWVRAALNAR